MSSSEASGAAVAGDSNGSAPKKRKWVPGVSELGDYSSGLIIWGEKSVDGVKRRILRSDIAKKRSESKLMISKWNVTDREGGSYEGALVESVTPIRVSGPASAKRNKANVQALPSPMKGEVGGRVDKNKALVLDTDRTKAVTDSRTNKVIVLALPCVEREAPGKVIVQALRAVRIGSNSPCKLESLRSGVADKCRETGTGNSTEVAREEVVLGAVDAGEHKICEKKIVAADVDTAEEEVSQEADINREEVVRGAVKEIAETNGGEQIKCKKRITVLDVDIGEEEVSREVDIDRTDVEEEDAPADDLDGNGTSQMNNDKKIRNVAITNIREGQVNVDIVVEEKRMTRSRVPKKKENAETRVAFSGTNQTEPKNCEEDSKKTMLSVVAKKRKVVNTIQKSVTEPEWAIEKYNEPSDSGFTGNKNVMQNLTENHDQAREGPSKKKTRSNSKKKLNTEKIRRTDNTSHQIGVEDFGVTHQKGVGLLRLRGLLKASSINKKTERLKKHPIRRKSEDSMETSWNTTSTKNAPRHQGRKNYKKSSSTIYMGKGQLIMEKTSPVESKISCELRRGSERNNSNSSYDENHLAVKGQNSSASETPLSTRQAKEVSISERMIAKQKLKDQIKDMLLKAGWKIDLRPRKGKNYDDSVYISPRGGSYWSITKAYDVFQRQLNNAGDVKVNNSSGKLSKASKGRGRKFGTGCLFSAIPAEALGILKKVIVNRRRTKAEMDEANKKLDDGNRSKKAKGAMSIKHSKSKHLKDKGREFKRIKRSKILDSSDKSISGYANKKQLLKRDREKRRGISLLARGSNQETKAGTDVYVPYVFKRTILSWMIDVGIMPATGKVKYMNPERTKVMLEGWITRNGIHCSCCSTILTVSMFEVHAGSKLCQPYRNVYLEEPEISLLQCQLNAWEKQDDSIRQSFYSVDTIDDDPNDDTCGICGDGGDLICCDGCPSTFHLCCLGIQMLPPSNWHCINCSCRFCGLASSPDPQENGLYDSSLLSCSQCEEKYHQKCVPEVASIRGRSTIPCVSFCSKSCKQLFECLQKLLGVKNDLDAGYSLTLLRRLNEDLPEYVCGLDQRVECNSKIAVALAVMDECFVPIIDMRSGVNLIHNVVYNCGSNFTRLNYSGFYTFILERDDEIISVASVRIHGTRLAEMPFIGTRNMYRRQGMCRRLLNGIESALCSLSVKELIIPAISELTDTWTNIFGFKPIKLSQKEELKSINMLVFPGTGLLLKPLQKNNSCEHCNTAVGVLNSEPPGNHCHTPEIANESDFSFRGLEPSASAEIIAQCEHKVEGNDPDSCTAPLGSCDAPHVPESQVLEYECSIANNQGLSGHPEVVQHADSIVDSNLQVASSFGPETELVIEHSNIHDDSKLKVRDACVVQNPPFVNGTLAKHTFDAKWRSPDATVSTLHKTNVDTAITRTVDGSSICHLDEVHCSSSNAVTSTMLLGNVLHIPVFSHGLNSDTSHYNGPQVASKTNTVFPVKDVIQTSTECMIDNHNVKHQVELLNQT